MPWWARWVLTAALAAVALQAAAAGAAPGILGAARLAGTAAATCACLLALLAGLPRTFTIGEALVAAQAAALLGSAALQHLLWSSSSNQAATQAEAAAPCQRFVLLLTAGSVLGSALLFPLLLASRQQAKRKERAVQSHPRGGDGSLLPTGLPATDVAAAAVAALAAAAAAPAALWALRFALATRRRLLLLCWWAFALVAALPAMGWLNRSGRVPPILGTSLAQAADKGWRPVLACTHCHPALRCPNFLSRPCVRAHGCQAAAASSHSAAVAP